MRASSQFSEFLGKFPTRSAMQNILWHEADATHWFNFFFYIDAKGRRDVVGGKRLSNHLSLSQGQSKERLVLCNTNAWKRKLSRIISLIDLDSGQKLAFNVKLQKCLLHSIKPVFDFFSHVRVMSILDNYGTFLVEAMHLLSLGICKAYQRMSFRLLLQLFLHNPVNLLRL